MTDLSSSSSSTDLDSDNQDEISIPRRTIHDRLNAFEVFDDQKFLEKFRLKKATVMEKLVHVFGHQLEPATNRNKSINATNQILITLGFYATGAFYDLVGDSIGGVHKSNVCRIVKKVSHHIALLKKQYIVMPQTQQERLHLKQNFHGIAGFPGIIGALGCTHVKIKSPGGNTELYRNRNGFVSINVQAVCDPSLKILNIVARWPGSVHNNRIFNDSALCAEFEAGRYGEDSLVGDKGYPCRRYLLTPFQNPLTEAEQRYNLSQSQTRNPIERCFRVLKRRFPCLDFGLRTSIDLTLCIIVACTVLHNIALEMDDELPDENFEILEDPEVSAVNDIEMENTVTRRYLVDNIFN